MNKGQVFTVLHSVPIEQYGSRYTKVNRGECFNHSEQGYLYSRNIRTSAGWLAAKHAVAELCERIGLARPDLLEIELFCDENGRPHISSMGPVQIGVNSIHISISHSRTTAHGLASFQGDEDGE